MRTTHGRPTRVQYVSCRIPSVGVGATIALVALALLSMQGCYNPKFDGEGGFTCEKGVCPEGYVCTADRVCEPTGGATDDARVPDGAVDAGDDGGTSDGWVEPSSACWLEGEPRPIVEGVESGTVIDFAADPRQPMVGYVSYGKGQSIYVRRHNGDGNTWVEQAVSMATRDYSTQRVEFTAVGAWDGAVFVAFSDADSSSGSGSVDPPDVLRFAWRKGDNTKVTDLVETSLAFDGGDTQAKFLDLATVVDSNAGTTDELPRVWIAQQARGNDTELIQVVFDSMQDASVANYELLQPNDYDLERFGLYNQLAVRHPNEEPEVMAGFVVSDLAGNRLLGPFFSKAPFEEMVGVETVVESYELSFLSRGLGLTLSENFAYAVWPRVLPGSEDYGLWFVRGDDTSQDAPEPYVEQILPDGVVLKAAGAPAIAEAAGAVGVAYLDDIIAASGALRFTARLNATNDNDTWTPALRFGDLGERVVQTKVLSHDMENGSVAFDVVFVAKDALVNTKGSIFHQRVLCELPAEVAPMPAAE